MIDIPNGLPRGLPTANHNAKSKIVAFNPLTLAWLNITGTGETANRTFSWVGTPKQFENIRKKEGVTAKYDLVSAHGETK